VYLQSFHSPPHPSSPPPRRRKPRQSSTPRRAQLPLKRKFSRRLILSSLSHNTFFERNMSILSHLPFLVSVLFPSVSPFFFCGTFRVLLEDIRSYKGSLFFPRPSCVYVQSLFFGFLDFPSRPCSRFIVSRIPSSRIEFAEAPSYALPVPPHSRISFSELRKMGVTTSPGLKLPLTPGMQSCVKLLKQDCFASSSFESPLPSHVQIYSADPPLCALRRQIVVFLRRLFSAPFSRDRREENHNSFSLHTTTLSHVCLFPRPHLLFFPPTHPALLLYFWA